ncbi:MAG: acetyl-CoA hydrolase/transferase C-terminal domain-containing protein [Acetobacteraceae bacterium]
MPRQVSVETMAEAFRPGERLYLPGSAGEPSALITALVTRPALSRGLRITSSAVPGINPSPIDRLDPSAEVTGLFMQPALRQAQLEARFHTLPLSFAGFVAHVRERLVIDTCVVQVATPDAQGRCSLGAAVEFTALVAAKAGRVFAMVNPAMPPIPGAVTLPYDRFDLVAEAETALPTYDVGAPSVEALMIAGHIAGLIEDGSALQAGLGKVPEAMFGLLHDRRGIRLQSGMLGDGALGLHRAGALDPAFAHASCVWVGSAGLYRELRDTSGFAVLGCEVTHDVVRLAQAERFVAVNSALSVDLFGQADLEYAGARAVSGVGGAPDFAQAARLSRGGISVVALPAAHGTPKRSRIVPRIRDGMVSLPRQMVDVVITENGIADLRGRTVFERAEALIGVAAPELRADLEAAWGEMKRQF